MTEPLKRSAALAVVIIGVVSMGWQTLLVAQEAITPTATAVVDPSQLLEMNPVGQTRPVQPAVSDELIVPQEQDQEPDSLAAGVEPAATAVPTVIPSGPLTHIIHAVILSPFYLSANLPQVDRTELDLGLLISQHPGLNVSLAWGATPELMASARLAVQGASYTTGLGLLYALRPELAAEIKPGLALSAQWRGQNFRTNDEARSNIYRGNRFNLGVVASKDLGSLALGLNTDQALVDFLHFFRLHVEALTEYQTGRVEVTEAPLSRLEFGIAGTMEIIMVPKRIYLTLTYRSLSDWLNEDDRYIGLRYYPREDFSLDLLGGWLGPEAVLNFGLGWLF